ncbi:MAG: ABC transporter ATP-binding protein [Cellvibrionaceae bacterium]|nr:ABC transporter ATP-binding protein [Cellvibrionaceae bacterium]
MPNLHVRNLVKTFGEAEVIKNINLDIDDKDFVVFVGPSGCGKSTMLRLIAGLEEATSGSIELDGKDITSMPPAKRDLAMVFQSYALYPHMTIRDNMSFALKLAGEDKAVIDKKINDVAKTLVLDHLLDRKPGALSGGQRQRVAIGRSIVRQPKIFLFDEPLSNLDAALRVQMRVELAKLHKSLDATMIYVTHDQVEAMTLADKVVVFSAGHIEQVGTPMELYHNPANLFVAEFIGTPKISILKGVIKNTEGDIDIEISSTERVVLPTKRKFDAALVGHAVSIGIRPEHISIVEHNKGHVNASVDLVENLGREIYCHILFKDSDIDMIVCLDGDASVRAGENIGLSFDMERLCLFDDSGNALKA